jgi:hypothetical protein
MTAQVRTIYRLGAFTSHYVALLPKLSLARLTAFQPFRACAAISEKTVSLFYFILIFLGSSFCQWLAGLTGRALFITFSLPAHGPKTL